MSIQYQRMLEEARRRVREVSVAEAKEAVDRGEVDVMLDVREPDEWARGRVRGAVLIPLGVLSFQANSGSPAPSPELTADRAARIVTYCARGNRSVFAAEALGRMGYTNVASMRGGIVDWAKTGYPVDR